MTFLPERCTRQNSRDCIGSRKLGTLCQAVTEGGASVVLASLSLWRAYGMDVKQYLRDREYLLKWKLN